MDPEVLAHPQWSELGHLLTNLWIMVAFIVFFATNLLIAHNWLQSFIRSRHLSDGLSKTSPVFYAVAISSFGAAMYMLSRGVDHAGGLRDCWPNYFI